MFVSSFNSLLKESFLEYIGFLNPETDSLLTEMLEEGSRGGFARSSSHYCNRRFWITNKVWSVLSFYLVIFASAGRDVVVASDNVMRFGKDWILLLLTGLFLNARFAAVWTDASFTTKNVVFSFQKWALTDCCNCIRSISGTWARCWSWRRSSGCWQCCCWGGSSLPFLRQSSKFSSPCKYVLMLLWTIYHFQDVTSIVFELDIK